MTIPRLRRICLLLSTWAALEIGTTFGLDLAQVKQTFLTRYAQVTPSEIFDRWWQLMHNSNNRSEPEKLRLVNDFFNSQIAFEYDYSLWEKSDYWATPLETMARGRGDCEDYAIAKYFSLLEQGIPLSKLQLVYVRASLEGENGTLRQQAHMVLAYYPKPNAEPLVLDNINKKILPASQRRDLLPIFSFNSTGYWQGLGNRPSRSPLSR